MNLRMVAGRQTCAACAVVTGCEEAAGWQSSICATAKMRVLFEEIDPSWVDYGFAGWSPDSKQILFTSEKDGFAHFYRVPVTGGDPTQMTRGNWEIRREPFSSKPQWIGDLDLLLVHGRRNVAAAVLSHSAGWKRQGKAVLDAGPPRRKCDAKIGGSSPCCMRMRRTPFDLWVNNERVTKRPRPGILHVVLA